MLVINRPAAFPEVFDLEPGSQTTMALPEIPVEIVTREGKLGKRSFTWRPQDGRGGNFARGAWNAGCRSRDGRHLFLANPVADKTGEFADFFGGEKFPPPRVPGLAFGRDARTMRAFCNHSFMFVDHIKMHAKAGDGGNGKVSFRRAKFIPKGGPDGGDGGNGGDVILQVDHHTDNLKEFFYQRMQKAEPGVGGGANQRTGKSGKALVLKVPQGTVVYRATPPEEKPPAGMEEDFGDIDDAEFDEAADGAAFDGNGKDEAEGQQSAGDGAEDQASEPGDPNVGHLEGEDGEELELLVDLAAPEQRFVLCKGGKGGKGNTHFKSSTNQAPMEAVPGTPGEEGWFYLELRKIADAGLVGFPNAGKSTLLRALSAAKPKVAAYPFTTLKPMVGVVELDGYRRATVADIPGLIEGAHANVGLGHEFLRHITRCRLLLFVVDLAAIDGRDPVSDIQMLRTEVKLYDEELSTRPWLIVANKIDLPESEEALKVLQARFPKVEILPMCAESGDGADALRERLMEVSHKRFD